MQTDRQTDKERQRTVRKPMGTSLYAISLIFCAFCSLMPLMSVSFRSVACVIWRMQHNRAGEGQGRRNEPAGDKDEDTTTRHDTTRHQSATTHRLDGAVAPLHELVHVRAVHAMVLHLRDVPEVHHHL